MNSSTVGKAGIKQKIVHELRELVVICIYLSVFFVVFRFYTRLILADYHQG
jgi:hypothetical protein